MQENLENCFRLTKGGVKINYDGSLIYDTRLDNSRFEKDLNKLNRMAKKGFTAVGAAAAAGMGAAVVWGANFEEAMSSVSAISMATADEYERLSMAAKEAGEATKYSATQAANALEYLSLAGYSADESIEALPKVLNLAAAGGMDLAYASDLLTDSMAVMGLGIQNMDNFSDQLAMAASKSNTNVAQLGEAVLIAGGQAKLAGMSVDQMNTALGILADKGIKGSEGGTALRNVLKNLYTPTSNAAKIMDSLGVKTADANGKLIDTQAVLQNLKSKLDNLSESDRMSAMGEIFDTRTIAAANALLDDCGSRWDELSGYLNNCDGAAAEMAETMNDNLKGKMKLLESAAEGLGIAFYEGIQNPLKEAVSSSAGYISEITKNIRNGELEESLDDIGKLLGKVTSGTMQLAAGAVPKLVSGISFLTSNTGTLAAVSGTLFAAYKAYPILGNMTKSIRLASAAIEAKSLATTLGTAAETRGITVSALRMKYDAEYVASLSAQQMGVGVLTGQTNLLTASQAAAIKVQGKLSALWAANPAGVAVAGTAALAAVLIAVGTALAAANEKHDDYIRKNSTMISVTEELKNSVSGIVDKNNEVIESVKNVTSAYSDAVQNTDAQAFANERLADTLFELSDKEGLTAAEKERMASIVDILNGNIDNLNLRLDSETGALNLTRDAVSQLIQKKKELAEANAAAENYEQALKAQYSAETQLAASKEKLNSIEEQRKSILSDSSSWAERYNSQLGTYSVLTREAQLALKDLDASEEELKNSQVDLNKAVEDSTYLVKAAEQRLGTEYPKSVDAAEKGIRENAPKVVSAVNDMVTDSTGGAAQKAQSEGQYIGEMLASGVADGINHFTGMTETASQKMITAALAAAKNKAVIKSPSKLMRDEVGKYLALGVASGIEKNTGKVCDEFDKMLEALNYRRDFDIISEDEYYTELERLRDRYFKTGTKEWIDYTKKIYDYQENALKQQKESIRDTYDNISEYASSKIDAVLKKQQAFAQKLKDFSTIANKNTVQIGDASYTYYSMHDIKKDTELMSAYFDAVSAVKSRLSGMGISEDVISEYMSQLESMEINEGTGFARALMRASEDELSEYMTAFAGNIALSKQYSTLYFKDDMDYAWEDSVKNMRTELEKAGYEIPEGFFVSGTVSAEKFGEAFKKELDEQLKEIRDKIAAFNCEPRADLNTAPGTGGNVSNTSNVFNITANSKETNTDTLTAWRNWEKLQKARGGY